MAPSTVRQLGPRPEGTDGSDHQYREVIESKYKRAPRLRSVARTLLFLTFPVVLLKTLWHLIPLLDNGSQVIIWGPAIIATYILSLLVWQLARPATARENLTLVKIAAVLNAVCVTLHAMTMFQYYVVFPKEYSFVAYPSRLHKFVGDKYGLTSLALLHAFTYAEVAIDALQLVLLSAAAWFLKEYVAAVKSRPGKKTN